MALKLLLVDDSAVMRKVLTRALRQAGLDIGDIVEAGDGLEALRALEETGDVDLILCDWNMPNVNGLDFIRAAANVPAVKEIPIIMVTTEGTEEKINEAKQANPNLAGYIPKPFTPARLRDAIEPILN